MEQLTRLLAVNREAFDRRTPDLDAADALVRFVDRTGGGQLQPREQATVEHARAVLWEQAYPQDTWDLANRKEVFEAIKRRRDALDDPLGNSLIPDIPEFAYGDLPTSSIERLLFLEQASRGVQQRGGLFPWSAGAWSWVTPREFGGYEPAHMGQVFGVCGPPRWDMHHTRVTRWLLDTKEIDYPLGSTDNTISAIPLSGPLYWRAELSAVRMMADATEDEKPEGVLFRRRQGMLLWFICALARCVYANTGTFENCSLVVFHTHPKALMLVCMGFHEWELDGTAAVGGTTPEDCPDILAEAVAGSLKRVPHGSMIGRIRYVINAPVKDLANLPQRQLLHIMSDFFYRAVAVHQAYYASQRASGLRANPQAIATHAIRQARDLGWIEVEKSQTRRPASLGSGLLLRPPKLWFPD